MSNVTVVIGAQWGDEGKGKLIDMLSANADVVCRCQGGNNAGHTVVHAGTKFFFHLLPSGMVNPNVKGVLGNGVVVNIPDLFKEIEEATSKKLNDITSRLYISNRCHLVLELHQEIDRLEEELRGNAKIGTTKKGIGPAYSSKVTRNGLRMCDLLGDWDTFCKKYKSLLEYSKYRYSNLNVNITDSLENLRKYREHLKNMVCDTVTLVNEWARDSKAILVEGAQSCMLDIDFGTYPHVTSSNCSVGGVCTGLGLPPSLVGAVYGVIKAYTTRVGSGCFPTELNDEVAECLRSKGHEYGVTTNRPRRIGWLDAVIIRYAHVVNNFTALALTKLDVVSNLQEVKICRAYRDPKTEKELSLLPSNPNEMEYMEPVYETLPGWTIDPDNVPRNYADLPEAARFYVETIERYCGVPIRWIGIGAAREAIIVRDV